MNFEEWCWDNNDVAGDGSGLDDTGKTWAEYIGGSELEQQIKMINPIAYLTDPADGDSAPNWYLRHGMRDRDTSFAVELELYYAALGDASIENVDFALAWLKPHSGNYDVQEAFAWLEGIL